MAMVTKTGSITTATGTVAMGVQGSDVVIIAVSGTHSGFTYIIEGLINGTWYNANAINAKNNDPVYGSLTPGTNATRTYYVVPGAYEQIRLRATARSTGTLTVQMCQSPGEFLAQGLGRRYIVENTGKLTAFLAAGSGAANSALVATGPGILHRIVVTTAGATAGMIVYDNATTNSGTVLYTSAATHALGVYELNAVFQNGITVRKASTTAAACVVYSLL